MPSASSKPYMSPGELATCEDFLDSHREYAVDLLSNIEKIHRWHKPDGCSDTRSGQTCTLCDLCSTDGLMGATKKALLSYEDAENHLKGVRASLGKCATSRAAPCRETLFRSNLAKVVFLCVATVGDDLRSQRATWQARLQGEVAVLSSSASSPQQTNTDSGNVNKNGDGEGLLPTYSGPLFVSPEADLRRTAMSTGSAPEVPSSSSMFVVFRRCLSSDCPCEANQANVASNVPSSPPLDPNKMLKSKVKRSSTTGRRSKKTSDTPDTVQARTGAQTQKLTNQSSETPALDTQSLRGMIPGKHETSGSTSGFVQETGSSSPSPECEALIVDPRIFTLRARITRSDDVYRALMKWCRSWMADLQLDMRENHEIGSTHESTRKGTLSVLPLGSESVTPEKLLCMTHQVEDVATEGLSPGDETIAREQQLDSEQEALKERWLTAQQKRGKGLKRHPAPARNFFSDQPKVYKQR